MISVNATILVMCPLCDRWLPRLTRVASMPTEAEVRGRPGSYTARLQRRYAAGQGGAASAADARYRAWTPVASPMRAGPPPSTSRRLKRTPSQGADGSQ
jgi:hypothetical protein